MSGRGAGTRRGHGVEKPWASGRVLTPEQRARKQEADRKANRFLKKEVQDRLSQLETRVSDLEKVSTGPNLDLDADNDQDERTAAERRRMRRTHPVVVKTNEEIVPIESVSWNAPGAHVASETSHTVDGAQAVGNVSQANCYASDNAQSTLQPSFAVVGASYTVPNILADSHEMLGSPDFSDVTSIARTKSEGRHMTCFLNNLVNFVRSLPPPAVCFEDQFNQDLVITAVLKGWDQTITRYHKRCPLWDVLRLVDMYLLRDTNMLERIGCLIMLHKRYLFEVNANLPTAGPPPPWYRPQYSGKVFFHDPVIDHLTWPSLRDRLIACEQDRMTNRFWMLYMRNLRVTWRLEPVDIMRYSPKTELYSLAPNFEDVLLDLDSWRMDMEFFKGLPQLAGDVPPFNYMPLRTLSPKFGIQGRQAEQNPSPQTGSLQRQQTQSQYQQQPLHPQSINERQQHQFSQYQQQHQMHDLTSEHSWLRSTCFLDDTPHPDLTRFSPGGTWQEYFPPAERPDL